ncbi:MAG: response regulator [Gemmatimonadales bacterium]
MNLDAHGGRTLRILIVDDDRFAADTARALLELAGHTVAVAYSGVEGIELGKQTSPDVVLCDLFLADVVDGYAVARALRADPTSRGALLIAITGFAHSRDRDEAWEAGFDRFVSKPVDVTALARTLQDPTSREPNLRQ